jgi:hypothetical protein
MVMTIRENVRNSIDSEHILAILLKLLEKITFKIRNAHK